MSRARGHNCSVPLARSSRAPPRIRPQPFRNGIVTNGRGGASLAPRAANLPLRGHERSPPGHSPAVADRRRHLDRWSSSASLPVGEVASRHGRRGTRPGADPARRVGHAGRRDSWRRAHGQDHSHPRVDVRRIITLSSVMLATASSVPSARCACSGTSTTVDATRMLGAQEDRLGGAVDEGRRRQHTTQIGGIPTEETEERDGTPTCPRANVSQVDGLRHRPHPEPLGPCPTCPGERLRPGSSSRAPLHGRDRNDARGSVCWSARACEEVHRGTPKAPVRTFSSTLTGALFCVGREGFEPSKAEPADLQSAPFGHSGTDPQAGRLTRRAALLFRHAHLRCRLRS